MVPDSPYTLYRTGTFAIAVETRDGLEPIVTHRDVGGLDQTSFMAELQGAIVALHSAVEAQTPVKIIIDNLSVQRGVAARLLSRLVKHYLDVYASGSQRMDGTQIGVRQVVVGKSRNAGGISMMQQMMLRVQRQSNVGVATWNL